MVSAIFASEAALCAAHIDAVTRSGGWTAYPETAGWDILYVADDGTQVGVQAKMAFNLGVLLQAVERLWDDDGPDFRAVLIPSYRGMDDLCNAMGVTLIQSRKAGIKDERIEFAPKLASSRDSDGRWARWHFRNPVRRCKLPRYVPDVAAGVPSPSTLSDWKIAALEICAVMEIRGFVTREDFRRADVDHRRWAQVWLTAVPGRLGVWRWKEGFKGFAHEHPRVYPKVLEDVRRKLILEPLGVSFRKRGEVEAILIIADQADARGIVFPEGELRAMADETTTFWDPNLRALIYKGRAEWLEQAVKKARGVQ